MAAIGRDLVRWIVIYNAEISRLSNASDRDEVLVILDARESKGIDDAGEDRSRE